MPAPVLFNKHGNLIHQPTLDKLDAASNVVNEMVDDLLAQGVSVVEIRAIAHYIQMTIDGGVCGRIVEQQFKRKRA